MSEAILVAVIGLAASIGGVWVGGYMQRKKQQADTVKVITDTAMSLIKPLRERIEGLENEVHRLTKKSEALKQWAEQLCCQVRDLGGQPVEYEEDEEQ